MSHGKRGEGWRGASKGSRILKRRSNQRFACQQPVPILLLYVNPFPRTVTEAVPCLSTLFSTGTVALGTRWVHGVSVC